MPIYRVEEIKEIVYVYQVEAENREEAIRKVIEGKADHLPEYDRTDKVRYEAYKW